MAVDVVVVVAVVAVMSGHIPILHLDSCLKPTLLVTDSPLVRACMSDVLLLLM
jgi:hypothetical protein